MDSYHECLKIMKMGERNRVIRQTQMSMKSSRSHAIFTLTLESRKKSSEGKLLTSKIHLCDLAGSERLHGDYNTKSM